VGLKQGTLDADCAMRVRQQSHHCGIETSHSSNEIPRLRRSNRTIVGLKLHLFSHALSLHPTQQSHHCGIETNGKRVRVTTLLKQQSHHCGIETLLEGKLHATHHRSNRTIVGLKHARLPPDEDDGAAIAPLWD